jgi:hypothetical protein
MRGGARTGSGSNAKLQETKSVLAVWLARAGEFRGRLFLSENAC